MRTDAIPTAAGALLFARYAYPPNALGYCGGDDPGDLLRRVDAGVSDPDLRRALHSFDGAWPYLELIAHANGIDDPLDVRVVEAYWVGNELLAGVDVRWMASSLEGRFRPRLGGGWRPLAEAAIAGARPHHNFHVFGVYPYVGLLRSGAIEEPLRVLDSCRVRWGRVVDIDADRVLARVRHLVWDGHLLDLGPPVLEWLTTSTDGQALTEALSPGDWCSAHWGWACDRLTEAQVCQLSAETRHSLRVAQSAPRTVLA